MPHDSAMSVSLVLHKALFVVDMQIVRVWKLYQRLFARLCRCRSSVAALSIHIMSSPNSNRALDNARAEIRGPLSIWITTDREIFNGPIDRTPTHSTSTQRIRSVRNKFLTTAPSSVAVTRNLTRVQIKSVKIATEQMSTRTLRISSERKRPGGTVTRSSWGSALEFGCKYVLTSGKSTGSRSHKDIASLQQ